MGLINLMQKTECYENHKLLLFKMAWTFSLKLKFDRDELISEFNVVFCEAFDKYDPDQDVKFSTFFCKCCKNRISNLLTLQNTKKRQMEVLTDVEIQAISHNPIESIIIYDNFVNNENEIIRRIINIVSIYPLPKTQFKKWLQRKLEENGYKRPEIFVAFKLLKTLFNSGAMA